MSTEDKNTFSKGRTTSGAAAKHRARRTIKAAAIVVVFAATFVVLSITAFALSSGTDLHLTLFAGNQQAAETSAAVDVPESDGVAESNDATEDDNVDAATLTEDEEESPEAEGQEQDSNSSSADAVYVANELDDAGASEGDNPALEAAATLPSKMLGVGLSKTLARNAKLMMGTQNDPSTGDIILASGTTGQVQWKVTQDINGEQTITIFGNGAMDATGYDVETYSVNEYSYSYGSTVVKTDDRPWADYVSSIRHIVVEEGVTSVCKNAFRAMGNARDMSLPNSLEMVYGGAFQALRQVTELTIPPNVQSATFANFHFAHMNVKELTIPAALANSLPYYNYAFEGYTNMETLIFEEGTTTIDGLSFRDALSLNKLVIPSTVTRYRNGSLQSSALLTEVYFNAANLPSSSIDYESLWAGTSNEPKENIDRDLYIGSSVQLLPAALLRSLSCGSGTLNVFFEEGTPFYFQCEDMTALQGINEPFSSFIAGSYYSDGAGGVYRIEDNGEATLVYVEWGRLNKTIPATIKDADGNTVPVTGVDHHALASSKLRSITFESPSTITRLKGGALADCASLEQVNGKTTIADAIAVFPNGFASTITFAGTKLEGSHIQTVGESLTLKDKLIITTSITENSVRTPSSDDESYYFYTGESAILTIDVSNPDNRAQDSVVRVYVKFSGADGGLDYNLGDNTFIINDHEYVVNIFKTDAVNTYCIEIPTPQEGDTISLTPTLAYPSPSSKGGTALVSINVLTKDELDALENAGRANAYIGAAPQTESESGQKGALYQSVEWGIVRDPFPLSKEQKSGSKAVVKGTASSDATISGLSYTIATAREGDTLEGKGKDYMRAQKFVDTFALPEGLSFSDDFLDAYRSGDLYWNYISKHIARRSNKDVVYFSLLTGESYVGSNVSVSMENDSTLVLSWAVENKGTTEASSVTFSLSFNDDVIVVEDPDSLVAGTQLEIDNTVAVNQTYTHSAPVHQEKSATAIVNVEASDLTFAKVSSWSTPYMGDDIDFDLKLKNTGSVTTTVKGASVSDSLTNWFYIKPERMQEMFDALDKSEVLQITISDGHVWGVNSPGDLATVKVSDIEGYQVTIPSQLSDGIESNEGLDNLKYNKLVTDKNSLLSNKAKLSLVNDPDSHVITITLEAIPDVIEKTTLTVGAGQQFDTIAAALDSIGFGVGANTLYSVKWDNPNDLSIRSNKERVWTVLGTAKNSFMRVDQDVEKRYNNSSTDDYFKTYNSAEITYDETKKLKSGNVSISVYRDFELTKTANVAGESYVAENLGNAAVVDYGLHISYKGRSSYDALPVVDHMESSQVLLVSVKDNPQLASLQLPCVTLADGDYYQLDKPGTYQNVSVGVSMSADGEAQLYNADTIIVTKGNNGWDTTIKWYIPICKDREDDKVIKQSESIALKSLVRLEWQDGKDNAEDTNPTAKVNNEAYLGDHMGYRLWHWVGPVFKRYSIDKSIVTSLGEENDPNDDKLVGYSVIGEGAQVTYRLSFQNRSDSIALISASYLSDALPPFVQGCPWEKGTNVEISYISKALSYPQVIDGDKWEITTDPDDETKQYISWADEAKFVVAPNGWAYVYVTLTYPTGSHWKAYRDAYSVSGVINSFAAFGEDSDVRHDLSAPVQVVLQKGVAGAGSAIELSNGKEWSDFTLSTSETSRVFYTNRDYRARFVRYYTTVVNDGESRLYVDTIKDSLPRGFSFIRLLGNNARSDIGAGVSKNMALQVIYPGNAVTQAQDPEYGKIRYLSYQVSAQVEGGVDGREVIAFNINKYKNPEASAQISWDEYTDRCYLEPGEAIELQYECIVDETAKTDDLATNIVGLELDSDLYDSYEIGNTAISLKNPDGMSVNDGDCETSTTKALSVYGFGGDEESTWLVSQVTQRRGSVLPGITKTLKSKRSIQGQVTNDPQSAAGADTLVWQVEVQNDGTLPLNDYVITDVMQKPYIFTGQVDYSLWRKDKVRSDADFTSYLFKFGERRTATVNGEQVEQVFIDFAYGDDAWLTIGGDPVTGKSTMDIYDGTSNSRKTYRQVSFDVSMSIDENGYEVLMVHFKEGCESIPEEGGRGVLSISTVNPQSRYENKVYYNTSYITPLSQSYDGRVVSRGNQSSYAVDWPPVGSTEVSDEPLPSVRNSVPVSVTFGYATSSVKTVEESGNPDNKASSDTPTHSFITLPAKNTQFIYTIQVGNTTDLAMTKLVLIDNLPEVGDHSTFVDEITRESRFKVSFVDNIEDFIEVVVYDKQGDKVATLNPSQYQLDFTSATEFTDADWDGATTGGATWTNAANDATRSIRLRIFDDEGTIIKPWYTVAMRLKCEVDDANATPGDKAWNSFGYHYKLKTKNQELEAAPLNVGVQFPNIPFIQKQLIDRRGNKIKAEQDEIFRFILADAGETRLFESANKPTGSKYELIPAEEVYLKVIQAGITPVVYVEVTVPAGSSVSEEILLDNAKEYCYNSMYKKWEETGKTFNWIDGHTYFALELPETDTDLEDMIFPDDFNDLVIRDWFFSTLDLGDMRNSDNGYEFVYNASEDQVIKGTNAYDDWDALLVKKGRQTDEGSVVDEGLGDAVFGLYSPYQFDALDAAKINALKATYDITIDVPQTVTYEGATYYLNAIKATVAEGGGTLVWSALQYDTYVTLELRAPSGYAGTHDLIPLTKEQANSHVYTDVVYNTVAYDLPHAGGHGAEPYMLLGLAAMIIAGIAFAVRRQVQHHERSHSIKSA